MAPTLTAGRNMASVFILLARILKKNVYKYAEKFLKNEYYWQKNLGCFTERSEDVGKNKGRQNLLFIYFCTFFLNKQKFSFDKTFQTKVRDKFYDMVIKQKLWK